MYPQGVSLIICTYNGAHLLQQTLSFILRQKVPAFVSWEVLVIDNASTDNTADVVMNAWQSSIPLRIINEPRKGLIYARYRGITEAKYEYLSFIDDDNWIDENWIVNIFEVFRRNPAVGICGSNNSAAFEIDPPPWFENIRAGFAIGRQGMISGDITNTRGHVWGAGMSFRKSAFDKIRQAGFESILTGRKGNKLAAGEDTELAFAFRLGGGRIWYEDELKLQHYIPAKRFDWNYILRMYKGFGESRALFLIYQNAIFSKRPKQYKYYKN